MYHSQLSQARNIFIPKTNFLNPSLGFNSAFGETGEMSYLAGEPISIRTIVKGANGLFSAMQSSAQANRDAGVIR